MEFPGNERTPARWMAGAPTEDRTRSLDAKISSLPDHYPVTGTLVVNLAGIGQWDDERRARARLWEIEHAPAGCHVRIMVGKVIRPRDAMTAGIRFDHVAITVEAADADTIRAWVTHLREATR